MLQENKLYVGVEQKQLLNDRSVMTANLKHGTPVTLLVSIMLKTAAIISPAAATHEQAL